MYLLTFLYAKNVKTNYKKLKGEVGMGVQKSKQTRVVGIITYMVHAAFLVMVGVSLHKSLIILSQ